MLRLGPAHVQVRAGIYGTVVYGIYGLWIGTKRKVDTIAIATAR